MLINDISIHISKAQQSCVSATALEQKIMRGLSIRINQKSRKKMIKKRSKHRPETYQISIQNRPKIDRKSIKNRSKINRKSIKIDQNHRWSEKCRALRLGSRLGGVLEASWARLRGQDSSKLASQIEGKSIKNPCKNQSKIRCLPSSNFDAFLMDFWRENGGMLAPKSDQKSISISNG